VFADNKAAIDFYQKHGFKTLTVIHDQLRVDGQSIDDVQMVLDLRSIQQTASIPTNESSSLQVFGRLGPEHLEALKHIELRSKSEKFSHSAVLTDLIGFNDLFVHHEIIPPGRRASSPHRHSHIEELFLVLKGHPTFHCGEQSWKVAPGAFIGFRPDQQDLHYVSNDSDEDVHLLGMSSDHPLDETIY
jgi:uncharacterized cupin superfamily protein